MAKRKSKRGQTSRCTAAEAAKRLNQVIEWLSAGNGRRQILQMGSSAWGVTHRQIDSYLGKAYVELRKDAEREREDLIAEGIARREALYRICIKAGDHSTARAVLTDLSRLRAEYATDRASLARAGLDKALTAAGVDAAGDALRELVSNAYESRTARGLEPEPE